MRFDELGQVVPRRELPREHNPRLQPHVLVIHDVGDGEKEFEIEHPETCPRVCLWSPTMAELVVQEKRREESSGIPMIAFDSLDCLVEYEVSNAGLDSLDLGADPPDDGTYQPASPWAMDRWRQLPPGRYLIEAWYQGGGWAGADWQDPDGGLALIGPEPPSTASS